VPLLALTHGQSETPTTVGKEFAVFAARLERQIEQLKKHKLLGKFGGATGTWSAHLVAYPPVDWLAFAKKFVTNLGLELNPLTTQIEPHDSLAESYHILERINTILLDFTKDVWLYVMRGVFGQKRKEGEVGSSTMPHKINPIYFENAEGNLGIANSYLQHLASKLPVSRLQRDLTDSTVLRNQGVPLGHSLLACENILTGLSRLTVNTEKLNEELEAHWEVLAEALQVVLRKHGVPGAYEKLKELTRGEQITKSSIQAFITLLDIPQEEKAELLKLTPQSYIGLASKLAEL
jgi:adenylosuccinate lyase